MMLLELSDFAFEAVFEVVLSRRFWEPSSSSPSPSSPSSSSHRAFPLLDLASGNGANWASKWRRKISLASCWRGGEGSEAWAARALRLPSTDEGMVGGFGRLRTPVLWVEDEQVAPVFKEGD